jgi:hypothetical protein
LKKSNQKTFAPGGFARGVPITSRSHSQDPNAQRDTEDFQIAPALIEIPDSADSRMEVLAGR